MNVTGIILAGGKSTRMGTEKGLQLLNGKTLIEYAIEAISSVCDTIVISSNSDAYSNLNYKVIADEIPGIGPMGGIYSALKQSESESNLVLSCDLPFVSRKLLSYILQMAPGYDVAVPWEGNQHYEPLCAFYNKNTLPLMEQFIQNNVYKLPEFFNHILVNKLIIDHTLPFYAENLFFNVNSKHDISTASNMMQNTK